jgi:hypothetical protein
MQIAALAAKEQVVYAVYLFLSALDALSAGIRFC